MKNPSYPGQKSRTIRAFAAAIALFATAGAFAQVKIPAKSASSLEGSTNSTEANGSTPTATSTSPFAGSSSVSKVTVPTPNSGRETVTVQNTPVSTLAPNTNVAATEQVPLPRRDLDPAVVKRLAELRRELGVSTAALSSRLALPANELFLDDAPTTLDDLAMPALRKVIEYIQLNDKQDITVQSFYDQAPGAKELSWTRSLALIEWMIANSELDVENIKAAGPAPVAKPTPKPNATEIGDTEYVNRIEVLLE